MTPYAPMPFYPGPTSLHPALASILVQDFPPPRQGDVYQELYARTCANMQVLLGTKNEVILPTGEAMVGLWGALKSLVQAGDTVLTVGNGVFGDGFADMALSLGANVERLSFPYNTTLRPEDLEQIEVAIKRAKPLLITAVHCETPSGTLNPLADLGAMKKRHQVPLFMVDAVASVGGAPVLSDAWHIDVVLGGSQKCLSCPPDMGILAISEAAWEQAAKVNYEGYDALLPFKGAQEDVGRFPYTPHWRGVAALEKVSSLLLEEGLGAVFARHENIAQLARAGLEAIGIDLWTERDAINSPTVTAAKVPQGKKWSDWQEALAEKGLIVGGSLGPMAGKVFRIGHMGTQANEANMEKALAVIKASI